MSNKIESISNMLARMYPDDAQEGACTCTGSCVQLGCSNFWSILLNNPEHLRKALQLYNYAQRVIERSE